METDKLSWTLYDDEGGEMDVWVGEDGHTLIMDDGEDAQEVDFEFVRALYAIIEDVEGRTSPDVSEWIQWDGGKCPVPGHKMVEVRTERGTFTTAASNFIWDRECSYGAVLAYRVIG